MSILKHIGNTPLVRLNRIGKDASSPLFGKCEHMNPGGSVKDRIALYIINDAEERGLLKPGMTIIEATAGNTGMGLALVAAARGYKLVCVLPEKMSVDKRVALATLGAQVIVTPNVPPSSPDYFKTIARQMAEENGWFLADQFNNPANVLAHYETTANEIIKQVDGPIGAFVSGSGTGGTISGVGKRLKEVYPDVKIILADPIGSSLAHWFETGDIVTDDRSYTVEGIGASDPPKNLDRSVLDEVLSISDEESFGMTKRLILEEGLLVGGSAGTNMAAALQVAMRDDINGPVVSILCDNWDRYRTQPWMQGWGPETRILQEEASETSTS